MNRGKQLSAVRLNLICEQSIDAACIRRQVGAQKKIDPTRHNIKAFVLFAFFCNFLGQLAIMQKRMLDVGESLGNGGGFDLDP